MDLIISFICCIFTNILSYSENVLIPVNVKYAPDFQMTSIFILLNLSVGWRPRGGALGPYFYRPFPYGNPLTRTGFQNQILVQVLVATQAVSTRAEFRVCILFF